MRWKGPTSLGAPTPRPPSNMSLTRHYRSENASVFCRRKQIFSITRRRQSETVAGIFGAENR